MCDTTISELLLNLTYNSIENNGQTLTKECDMLEALNHHFVSVGLNLAKKIEVKPEDDFLKHITPVRDKMKFKAIDDEYVLNAISRLEKGKASGPDKVSVSLVQDAAKSISYPLALIYNSSLKNGVFPEIWKIAKITPIYKSGARTDVNNYRPISVISVFSRMLERISHDQLFEFLQKNDTLTDNQAAFRKLYSTMTSLIASTDYWYENIDCSKINLTIFLDLKKAFDTVDHSILIQKLQKYGIKDRAGEWFESYLTNRQQFCSLNGVKTKPRKVPCGIPQGSCLGPLLFIIYLNDVEKCLQSSHANIYADDTAITIASNNVMEMTEGASKELANIAEWMRVNKLSPNPQKTEFMIIGHPFSTKNPELPETLELNGSEVKRVERIKYLGIIINENLNWDEQFKRIKSKINTGLMSLKRLRNTLPQSQLCSVYYGLVESHLRYGDVVWGSLNKTKIKALQRLQNRACSIIENARIKDNWSRSWLNVENIIRYDRNTMTYKIMNKLCPEKFFNKFFPRSSVSKYNTRNCRDLQIPRYRTEFAKKGFHYSALKAWNHIPAELRELPTQNSFKKQLKIYLKG